MHKHILLQPLVAGRALEQAAPILPALDQLSPREQQNLAPIQQIHAPGIGLIQRLRDSDLLTADSEWWVAGPPEVLPFAGS